MAHTIIDRTLNGKRSSGNRAKFVKRVKRAVRDQVNKQIANGSIDDLVSGRGKSVTVPKKDLKQPTFNHGKGGNRQIVHPGNKKFVQGDRVNRPKEGGGGGGKGASKDGEGEDSFQFQLTFEEFLDIFFEDCELPDLRETVISKTDNYEMKRAGFSTDGPSAQLNLERTMRQSKGRRIGLLRKGKKKELAELEEKVAILEARVEIETDDSKKSKIKAELETIYNRIVVLRRKLRAVPFIDDTDLRYNRWEKNPVPTSQAVMFCIMDVSGSMGEWEKEMAKRYFMLTYLFLTRNYERIEVVWIRHHSTAKETDEKEFFESRESGGTIVSSALDLMIEIVEDRYPTSEWNIYGGQASDGDNWGEDSQVCVDLLANKILPMCQYYTYIELNRHGAPTNQPSSSDLWPAYEMVAKQHPHFQMRVVSDVSEIYPVFKELFKKNKKVK